MRPSHATVAGPCTKVRTTVVMVCVAVITTTVTAVASHAQPLHLPVPIIVPGERSPGKEWHVGSSAPFWLELPRGARVWNAEGLDVEPLHNAGASVENLRVGVLIGAFRYTGRCVDDLRFRLQYVDDAWASLGPAIENEARVSRAGPGDVVPYRFRLNTVDDLPSKPTGYVIVVDTLGNPHGGPLQWNRWRDANAPPRSPARCDPVATRLEALVTRRQSLRTGFRLEGRATLAAGGPVRLDAITITALLRDVEGEVLEVLVGTPTTTQRTDHGGMLQPGDSTPFTLRTDVPLGRFLDDVTVIVEVLPDVQVVPDDPDGR